MSKQKELTGYPSIDKPWLKYFDEELLKKPLPKCTVYQNIYENNKEYLNDTAIQYFGNKISYAGLFENVETVAKALKASGVQKGEVVNICTAGIPEAIYLMLACNRLGTLANFINPLFTPEQMSQRLAETESSRIFVMDAVYEMIEEALKRTKMKEVILLSSAASLSSVAGLVSGARKKSKRILKDKASAEIHLISWEDFLRRGNDISDISDEPYVADTPAIMVYSSGSTGASKGIVLTNDGINATIANYDNPRVFPYQRGNTFLQMIPIWFSTGIVLSILMPLRMGSTVILEPQFSKESFAQDLAKYKPTMTLAATSLWKYVIQAKECRKADFSSVVIPVQGGEKLLSREEKQLDEFLSRHNCKSSIICGYGMCELGSTIATAIPRSHKDKLGGNGYPILNAIVAAFDLGTNKELKYGEHGELRVISPARMKGYYKNEVATDAFFYTDEQGRTWGCTGDIGYVDEDGEVFVLGRATDSATLDSGKKVYLFDIEDVILQEESLSGCKVVATKENGKTVLAAHMTVRSEVSYDEQSLAQKIHENCKKNLPADEVPTKYKFRDAFPVHPNGKRDNDALRQEKDGVVVIE